MPGVSPSAKKIAAMAEAAYAKVALRCPFSPVALVASLQLAAAIPNLLVQAHNEVNGWHEGGTRYTGKGFLREPFVLGDDGCVAVSQGPGLGIVLDEEAWPS